MINVKDIIPKGQPGKYQVIIEHEGFSMTENDFELLLTWGMRGQSFTIPKSAMLQNEGSETFFEFATDDMVGVVTVECRYWVPDTDFADGVRLEMERQPLCFVNEGAKLPSGCDCGLFNGQHVSYVRRNASGLRSLYDVLRDVTGAILRDVNGLVLRALKRN